MATKAEALEEAAGYELPSDVRAQFEKDGCIVLRGFASKAECEEMMGAMGGLIDAWDPATLPELSVFRTDGKQKHKARPTMQSSPGPDKY